MVKWFVIYQVDLKIAIYNQSNNISFNVKY